MNLSLARRFCPSYRGALAGLGLLLAVGCTSGAKRTPLMTETKQPTVTRREINYQLFDFVARYSRTIEGSADQIAAATANPAVRRQALLWKIYAVPAAFLALEHQDPVAVLLDLWALCVQQTDYLTEGAGRDLFGDQQPVAVTAVRRLETEAERLATGLLRPESVVTARQEIAKWSREHPLENSQFARPSIISVMARIFPDGSAGLFQTLNSLEAEVADLKGRLTLQVDSLPRQARWQAELMATDSVAPLIAGEREAVLADVDRQRVATLEAVRQERIAVLQAVTTEREAVVTVARELVANSLADVERIAAKERKEILKGINLLSQETREDLRARPLPLELKVEESALAILDHLWPRVLLLAAVGYLVFLGTLVLGYIIVRRRASPGSRPTGDTGQ